MTKYEINKAELAYIKYALRHTKSDISGSDGLLWSESKFFEDRMEELLKKFGE